MLDNLRIKNFRVLADFHAQKLGHVNLIVGKNNSGKSTVLEALRVFAARGNWDALLEIALSHDEFGTAATSGDGVQLDSAMCMHFFHGRVLPTDSSAGQIYIGNAERSDFVEIDHVLFYDQVEYKPFPGGLPSMQMTRVEVPKQQPRGSVSGEAIKVRLSESEGTGWATVGGERSGANMAWEGQFWEVAAKKIPVSYVPTHFLSDDYLAQLWDNVQLTPAEGQVLAALRIVDSEIEDLRFVKAPSDNWSKAAGFHPHSIRARAKSMPVVKRKGIEKRLPLSGMGDGMLRVLQLALAVHPAKDGMLLVEEFDNGLHWSIQERIWEMLFAMARDLNIQVFATTHSEDAVRAFSAVSGRVQETGVLLKLARKPGLEQAVCVVYDEELLHTATMTETEVR